jgi:hypothetical protein
LDRVTCYTWERKKEAQVENLKKQHTPSFKTKVALEALKGNKTSSHLEQADAILAQHEALLFF